MKVTGPKGFWDDWDESGPSNLDIISDLDAGTVVSDAIEREFSDFRFLVDHDLSDHDLDDVAREDLSDPDDDPNLEAALDGCPFDIDELLDDFDNIGTFNH